MHKCFCRRQNFPGPGAGDESQAKLSFAIQDSRRYARASASGAGTEQSSSQADTSVLTAQAQLASDKAALLGTMREVDVLNAALSQSQASLAQSQARASQAALDLSHTQITAPFDGMVGNKTVAMGDYLEPGTQIMALVPLTQVYVLANYKEHRSPIFSLASKPA